MSRLSLAAVALAALSLTACDSADPVDPPTPQPTDLVVERATDIYAPTSGVPPAVGGRFALYSLREDRLVLSSAETDAAVRQRDSASTAWDIGFRGTEIIFNGGARGPGQGAAQIVDSLFAEVTTAPADGYVADGSNTACPAGTLAICTGSNNGWYNYDGSQNLIAPLPGRTIVLKTAVGTYAKVRILSYYRGNPATPNGQTDTPRYFTFEYVVQPDGSRGFETTTADGE